MKVEKKEAEKSFLRDAYGGQNPEPSTKSHKEATNIGAAKKLIKK